MGAKFDDETLTLTRGQSVMDALKEALQKKGLAARMEDGLIIDDVHVLSITENEVVCRVDYEYGA